MSYEKLVAQRADYQDRMDFVIDEMIIGRGTVGTKITGIENVAAADDPDSFADWMQR